MTDYPTLETFKKIIKEAMREVIKEMEEEDKDKPITSFNMPCYSCKQPVKNGESFVIYHGACIDRSIKAIEDVIKGLESMGKDMNGWKEKSKEDTKKKLKELLD